ncbi:MAG: glycosyltransferase [Oscillospiraceae bacterium]
MKVLMQIRDNYLTGPGGDTIQLLKTKEALEKLGVNIDISTELEPNLEGYDLVHIFNLTRIQESFIQTKNAIKQKKKIALSTIYWPYEEINADGFTGIRKLVYKLLNDDEIESVKALYKYIFRGQRNKGCRYLITHKYSDMQKYVVNQAGICLPNAATEMKKIEEVMGIKKDEYVVVPNAIDKENCVKAWNESSDGFDKYKGYIVCVARISRRKNQLMLMEALEGTDYKVLFVGKSSPGEMDYYQKFLDKLKTMENAEYVEFIPNDKLYSLYKVCKVSVLPSWFETPGLVSLEAAAMGCNIAITDKGTTRDYFGEDAYYFNLEKESMRKQISKAYSAMPNEKLREKILTEYTWDMAAKRTLEGYRKLIG